MPPGWVSQAHTQPVCPWISILKCPRNSLDSAHIAISGLSPLCMLAHRCWFSSTYIRLRAMVALMYIQIVRAMHSLLGTYRSLWARALQSATAIPFFKHLATGVRILHLCCWGRPDRRDLQLYYSRVRSDLHSCPALWQLVQSCHESILRCPRSLPHPSIEYVFHILRHPNPRVTHACPHPHRHPVGQVH